MPAYAQKLVRGVASLTSLLGGPTIALLALLFFVLTFSYSLLTPLFQSPDETAHLDLMVAAAEPTDWPSPGERHVDRRMLAARSELSWTKVPQQRTLREAPPRDARPTFVELRQATPSEEVNAAAQHPPLYYVLGGTVGTAISAALGVVSHVGFDQYLSILRFLNILLVFPLPILVYRSTRVLGYPSSTATVAAIVPIAIPQLVFLGGTVNNDNLLLLAFAIATYYVARVVSGDTSQRTAICLGLSIAVGLLAKSFALLALVWIPAVYLFAAAEDVALTSWTKRWRPMLTACSVALIFGGWWWIRNLLKFGILQPRLTERSVDPPAGFSANILDWARGFWPRIGQSFWGDFNYLNIPIPMEAVILASVALLTLVLLGLSTRRGGGVSRLSRSLLALPMLLLVLGVGYQQYSTVYLEIGRFPASQGRYLFGGVPALAVLAGVGSAGLVGRWPRAAPTAVLGGGLILHAISIYRIADSFYLPAEGWPFMGSLRTALAWSPWAGEFTATVWLSAVLLGGIVVWRLSSGRPTVMRAETAEGAMRG